MTLVAPGTIPLFKFHDLPTNMARRLLVVELGSLAIGTVHLESLANHIIREKQLQVCAKTLASFPNVLLVGDFNFDSERNYVPSDAPLENKALAKFMPDFADVWPDLRTERGFTYDSVFNPYIGTHERMRYDRVMARLKDWRATGIDLFGQAPVDHMTELSDLEKVSLERPPTPPRPRAGPLPSPWALFDDVIGDSDAREGAFVLASMPDRPEMPPSSRGRLFLSDHFGLLVTMEETRDA